MTLRHQVIATREGFLALRSRWEALLGDTTWHSVCQLWEWSFHWWEAFGGELYILVLTEDDADLAILPLLRIGHGLYDRLAFIGAPFFDYQDFIVRSHRADEVVAYLFEEIVLRDARIAVLDFDSINERSESLGPLRSFAARHAMLLRERSKLCPYIDLPTSWESYLSGRSRNFRYDVRRSQRKCRFVIDWERDRKRIQQRLGQLIAQHQALWRERDRPGAFADRRFERFQRTLADAMAERGMLRLYYLEVEGAPIASYYLFRYADVVSYYLSGFDPASGDLSPGTVLMAGAVRASIAEGAREFDMMRGEGSYKFRWTDKTRTDYSLLIVRPGLAGRLHRLRLWLGEGFSDAVKMVLPKNLRLTVRRLLPRTVLERLDTFLRHE